MRELRCCRQDDESGERVVSFDVVPAFRSGDDYEIPDTSVPSGWTKTNPRIHEEKRLLPTRPTRMSERSGPYDEVLEQQ